MWGVVFGVCAAGVGVVVLDEVFKEAGVEVELLGEDAFEAELAKLVDDGTAEGVALAFIGDVLAEAVEEDHLGAAVGLNREDIVIGAGDVNEGVIEELGEVGFVLAVEETGDEMLDLESSGVWGHLHDQ